MRWTSVQLDVINYDGGHAKVVAVAGSGKSTVLVERIARIIERGVHPKRIRVAMFNDSACTSFQQKLTTRLGLPASKIPTTTTFHSMASKVTQQLIKLGHLPGYRLETDNRVQTNLAKAALIEITGEKPSNEMIEAFSAFVGIVKSDIISAADKLPEMEDIAGKAAPGFFVAAFVEYERMRHENRIRFFADLIYDLVALLQAKPELQALVQFQLDHFLIDEYQDITEIQQALVAILVGNATVTAVGDVDQCIYEWAGAKPEFLETLFDVDFPNPQTFFLNSTFRYGHAVSLLSNAVIANNPRRLEYRCLSHESNPDTEIFTATESPDGSQVAEAVRDWVEAGGRLSDIALLVRLHACSAGPELGLLAANIPYKKDGSRLVLDRVEARMVIGYLRTVVGRLHAVDPSGAAPADYLAGMLLCPSLPLHSDSVKAMAGRIVGAGAQMLDAAERYMAMDGLEEWKRVKVRARMAVIEAGSSVPKTQDAAAFLNCLYSDLDLVAQIKRASFQREVADDKIALLFALRDLVKGKSIAEAVSFFDDLLVRSASMKLRAEHSQDVVTIKSVHAAKGLEWPFVIVPGLREGLFPVDTGDSEPRLQAERRLFYVACTRAINRLLLLHPQDTDLAGAMAAGLGSVPDGARSMASRFLFEANIEMARKGSEAVLNEGFVAGADVDHVAQYAAEAGAAVETKEVPYAPASGRLVCGPNTPFKVEVGMTVEDEVHGRGVVRAIYPRAGTHSMEVEMHSGKMRVFVGHVAELKQVI